MVGELLEQMGPLARLALGEFRGYGDELGRLARGVMISAFEREIDEPADFVAAPILGADRDLARDQRRRAERLKRRQKVADRAMRLVDPVHENEVRNALFVEHPQGGGGQSGARDVGIDDDDGEVGDRDRALRVGRKTDRSGRIDQGERSAEIFEMHQIEFGRAAARARFGAAIADAAAVPARSLALDRTAREQQRFGQIGLARAGRSDQRDHSSAFDDFLRVLGHVTVLPPG